MNPAIVLGTFRLNFLILTPVCVFLGAAVAVYLGHDLALTPLLLALLGGVTAHISVNALNEYLDFASGLDLKTEKTPFSGGSGTLPTHPEQKSAVLIAGIATLVSTILIGLYFVVLYGPALLPLGMLGVLIILLYTRTLNRLPWLCLISPGMGFGILMVAGTQFVLTGHYEPLSFVVGLVPFLLVNNLLLLNQYPDITADQSVGRHHLPIAYGDRMANRVYFLQWLSTGAVIIGLVIFNHLPAWVLVALAGLIPGFFSWLGAHRLGFDIAAEPRYLALNVVTTLLTPALLSVALLT